MKTRIRMLAIALIALAAPLTAAAAPPDPKLKLPEFASLEKVATEVVTITLDAPLLKLAAGFLDARRPEDAAAKEVLGGIAGIYVHSFTFESDFVYPLAEVERVRKQLAAPGWQRLVEVRNRKEQTQVDIHVCMNSGKSCGLAIIASEPREFTIVNIVGTVDLEKLHHLEGRFGIPKMELEEKEKSGR